jgi:TPR repeat protein
LVRPRRHPIGDDTEQFGDEQDDRLLIDGADSDEGDFAPLMLDGLETAASKGNALAHYALALIHAPDNDEDTDQGDWKLLLAFPGTKRSCADRRGKGVGRRSCGSTHPADKYARHLREAGRLGNQHALLDLRSGLATRRSSSVPRHDVGADPSAVAEIAERLGRVADAKHWLTVAAESGDTDAMLRLIEEHDQGDLARCWTWVYLSRLVGTDLSKDAHYAINEDGSEYDDDVGGPAYAAGRDGVDLESISVRSKMPQPRMPRGTFSIEFNELLLRRTEGRVAEVAPSG